MNETPFTYTEWPEGLLLAQQSGELVFFCGAGVSMNAKLPGFKDLTDYVRNQYPSLAPKSQKAFDDSEFDACLNIYEKEGYNIRAHIFDALRPGPNPNLSIHDALLTLSQSPNNKVRLITTNYDHLFEDTDAFKKINPSPRIFAAPLLPIPKHTWSGLVYIHGRFPDSKNDTEELNNLIATSSDFGKAYLIDRYASRFITELFKHYTVCFVGYSAGDRIIRYLLDAIAAEQQNHESFKTPYAIDSYSTEKDDGEEVHRNFWELHGVTPVLFPQATNGDTFGPQNNKIRQWANEYKRGNQFYISMIALHLQNGPGDDDITTRLCHSLVLSTGLINTLPDIKTLYCAAWLEHLTDTHNTQNTPYRHTIAQTLRSSTLEYALWRIQPFDNEPLELQNCLTPQAINENFKTYREIAEAFAQWIANNIQSMEVFLWLYNYTGIPSVRLISVLKESWSYVTRWDDPSLGTAWYFYLNGMTGTHHCTQDLIVWQHTYENKDEKLNSKAELMLQEMLRPRISVSRFWTNLCNGGLCEMKLLFQIKLNTSGIYHYISLNESNPEEWEYYKDTLTITKNWIPSLTQCLKEVRTLQKQINDAPLNSAWRLSSISPSDRRALDYNDNTWVLLLPMLRLAWKDLYKSSPAAATKKINQWIRSNDEALKRLALDVDAETNTLDESLCLQYLTNPKEQLLTDKNYFHEVMRWLRKKSRLLHNDSNLLEKLSDRVESLRSQVNRDSSKICLIAIQKRLTGIKTEPQDISGSIKYLEEEFFDYHLGPYIPEDDSKIESIIRLNSDWCQYCRDFPSKALEIMFNSLPAEKQKLPASIRRLPDNAIDLAFQTWAVNRIITPVWSVIKEKLSDPNSELLQNNSKDIADWLRHIAQEIPDKDKNIFSSICRKILWENRKSSIDSTSQDGSILYKIDPVGNAMNALLRIWSKNKKSKIPLPLPKKLLETMTDVLNPDIYINPCGRICIMHWSGIFYRENPQWVKEQVIPLLNWSNTTESTLLWEGLLFSVYINLDFIEEIQEYIIETSKHLKQFSTQGCYRYALLLILTLFKKKNNQSNKALYAPLFNCLEIIPDREFLMDPIYQHLGATPASKIDETLRTQITPIFKDFLVREKGSHYEFSQIMRILKLFYKNDKETIKESTEIIDFVKTFVDNKRISQLSPGGYITADEQFIATCKHFPKSSLSLIQTQSDIKRIGGYGGQSIKCALIELRKLLPEKHATIEKLLQQVADVPLPSEK